MLREDQLSQSLHNRKSFPNCVTLQVSKCGEANTFRILADKVDSPRLGPEVFACALDPDVHALDLV